MANVVDETNRGDGPDRRPDGVHSDASQMDAPSGTNVVHVVQADETLAGIAAEYGTDVNSLITLNSIADPSSLHAGRELRIPATAPDGTIEIGADGNMQGRGSDTVAYTVGVDETLAEIAARFGTSEDALRRLNGLAANVTVRADQEILVPAGSGSTNQG